MEKKGSIRYVFIAIISILLIISIILLNTYAFWKASDYQTGHNDIIGSCLNISFDEEVDSNNTLITGFDNTTLDVGLPSNFPISDLEGANTTGYTFKITNECSNEIDYQLVLESLFVEGKTNDNDYFNNKFIKVEIDNGAIKRYEDLTSIDKDSAAPYYDQIRETRHILSGTIKGKTDDPNNHQNEITHTLKLWISNEATREEAADKVFNSRIKVFAGQNLVENKYKIVDATCFESISQEGYAYHYNYDLCGTDLVMSPVINGVLITNTYISNYLFADNGNRLTSLDISSMYGLKTIGSASFYDYVGTGTDLIIPDNVETIEYQAFNNFNGKSLVLPENLKEIGRSAFYSYVGTGTDLVIPEGVEVISHQAFTAYNGNSLKLGQNIKRIETNAFLSYEGAETDLIIPSGVEYIGVNAFFSYKGSNLTLSPNITEIDVAAFSSYNGNSFTLPSNIKIIGAFAFSTYKKDITIPSSIESIGEHAFDTMPYSSTIYVDRPNLSGVEQGERWNGSAQVKCKINGNWEVCPDLNS